MFDVFGVDSSSGPPSPSEIEERRAIFRPAYIIAGVFIGMIQGSLVGVVVLLAMRTLQWPPGDFMAPAWVPFDLVRWGMSGGLLGGAAGAIVWPGTILVIKKTREIFGPDLSLATILIKPSYGAWLFPVFFHSLVGFVTGGFGVSLSAGEEEDLRSFQGGSWDSPWAASWVWPSGCSSGPAPACTSPSGPRTGIRVNSGIGPR